MSNLSELHVAVLPALADAVRQAVESGEYDSDDEVVAEALLVWRLSRELEAADSVAIGQLWDEGLASGAGRYVSADEMKREARRRLAAERSRAEN
jgi:antitoxin ParD1/3/4